MSARDVNAAFGANLAALRREAGITQRKAAADLQISQGLLCHYEKGDREPGLEFLCRACDYYHVTADFLLGRGGSEADRKYVRESLDLMARDMQRMSQQMEDIAARVRRK